MGLFGSSAPSHEKTKEKVNEISKNLRQESRKLDRQIYAIEREEHKTIAMVKQAAKKGDTDTCKVLAKGLVQSKRQKSRIYASKAQLNSVVMQMKNQVAQMKLAGSIKSSTEVMKAMSGLMKLPEMQKTMTEMSKEMMKMGIMEEMMEDTLDSVLDDVDEGVVDEEVEKVLFEITKGKLEGLPSVNTASLPAGATATADVESEDEEPLEEMTKRLDALRS